MKEPLTLHKYMYAHANPVVFTDPSGLFATDWKTALVVAGILAAVGGSIYYLSKNSASDLMKISDKQRDAVARAGRPQVIPLLKSDQKGCFSTDYARQQPNLDWAKYEEQVSRSPMNFLAVTPDGVVGDYDGLTSGTRNVWEAKLGNDWLVDLEGYAHAQSSRWIAIDMQKNRQIEVAGKCAYNLTWAFSDWDVFKEAEYRWTRISPPKPNMKHENYKG